MANILNPATAGFFIALDLTLLGLPRLPLGLLSPFVISGNDSSEKRVSPRGAVSTALPKRLDLAIKLCYNIRYI